jgi:hypothetical protein
MKLKHTIVSNDKEFKSMIYTTYIFRNKKKLRSSTRRRARNLFTNEIVELYKTLLINGNKKKFNSVERQKYRLTRRAIFDGRIGYENN